MESAQVEKKKARKRAKKKAVDRAAAFFDLDRTLMAGASAYHFGRAAYKAGMISRRQILNDTVEQLRFRVEGATDEKAHALAERILDSIRDRDVKELARLSPDVMAGILPRVYPQMLEVVKWHQDEGRPAYIATAAWQEVSDLLAATLAMEGAIATKSEIADGRYTGRFSGPFTYGKGKAEAVAAFAAENKIDLSSSYAYSDAVSDLPFLELVGKPVAVNPDAALRDIALERDWEVMHFEKLGRRIKVGFSIAAAAAVGGSGSWLAMRRKDRPRVVRSRIDALRS